MISCLRFAAMAPQRCRIWCDNLLVMRRTQAILEDRFTVHPTTADCDLWYTVAEIAAQVRGRVFLAKVTSHVSKDATTPEEAWVIDGNNNADRAAAYALESVPAVLKDVSKQVIQAAQMMQQVVAALHGHFMRVAALFLTRADRDPSPPKETSRGDNPPPLDLPLISNRLKWEAPQRFMVPQFHQVLQWMNSIVTNEAPISFVSWHELYISFQLLTRLPGFCKHGQKQWVLLSSHQPWQFLDQCRHFAQYIQGLIKLCVGDWKAGWHKPQNPMYLCWTGGLWLRFAPDVQSRVRDWLRDNLLTAVIHAGGDLRQLPRADDMGETVAVPSLWSWRQSTK